MTHQEPETEELVEEKIETEESAPITEEMEEATDWQMKAEEYLVDLKRAQADFENYKKRQQESQKELGGYLIEKLVLDIIPVLDNFRAATMHVPDEQKESPWVVGIQYIEKQLEDVIKANGVEVIEVKEGDAFNPAIHEAIDSQQKAESSQQEEQADKIVKVLQKGFKLGDKVVRPAKVTVK